MLVAELTGRNPNVLYELGIAHTLGKPVVMITQSLDDVPFDLRHHRSIPYTHTPRGAQQLEEALSKTLQGISASRASGVAGLANGTSERREDKVLQDVLARLERAEIESKRALLVHRYRRDSSIIPWSRSDETGRLGIRLFNEGPAIARDVQLTATLPDGSVRRSDLVRDIPRENERTPQVRITRADVGNGDDRVVGYKVTWRDGNGPQEMRLSVRIQGEWSSDWRTTFADQS